MPAAALDDDGNLMRRALSRGIEVIPAPEGLALYRRLPGAMPSYSGRRREMFGLRTRLTSLRDTVEEIEAAGKLDRYRAPLAVAIDALARDTNEPAFLSECKALKVRIGGAPVGLALRRRMGFGVARLMARCAEWRIPLCAAARAFDARTLPGRCRP